MNRLGIVVALALASVSSIACTASSEDEQTASSEETKGSKEAKDEHVGQTAEALSCQRFPRDTCVTLQTYCNNHGGQLWCDLQGNCTCVYARAAYATEATSAAALAR